MTDYPKLSELKNWSPVVEAPITKAWQEQEANNFDPKTKKKIYSIDTPPPYVNTPIHMGHAITYCFMDMFARYKRSKGYEVLFPLGLDRNGLPIELGAEKKFKISALHMPRDEFIQKCKELLESASEESIDSFAKLGISFSSYKKTGDVGAIYHTDSPEYRSVTQATFINLFKKGLIYEDSRINNWDPKLQSTVADAEIDYADINSKFSDIKWKVKETGEEIVIGTTRPELICTCGMVIFNPEDSRYTHLEGKTAITPIFGKEVPIRSHPLADIDKGTGLVMMCSAGDLSDIQFFREMNIKPTIAIEKDGKMNEHAGFMSGLKVKEARAKILETIEEQGLLAKQESITHRTPISERSKAEIEFIEMPEFYLKQMEYVPEIKTLSTEINFYSPESKQILDRWLDSVSIDWPISRRRFYATPIPLWSTQDNGETLYAVPPIGEYYEPWKSGPPESSEIYKAGKHIGNIEDFPQYEWTGETRVLDTWFDSSISELVMLQYTKDEDFFQKAYPATLRPQGKEIVRTWLYYTVLRGYLETGKPCFQDVWIHNHILDSKGRKMSKSLGNMIDPQKLMKEYGAEAMRLWATVEGDLSKQDFTTSEMKIKGEMKTLNKLINITKFISQFDKPKSKPKLTALDETLISYIDSLTHLANESYNKYDFYRPANKLRHFLWEILASHYLELVKNRAYNEESTFTAEESNAAKYTLHYLIERTLTLLNPIIPQITSTLASNISLSLEEFPESKETDNKESLIQELMEFNSEIWKKKKDSGLSLRSEISGIEIPESLKDFESDLKAAHNLK